MMLGRLRARVVARDVEAVGADLGRGPHQRPLGVIAIAAGAEHAQQTAAPSSGRADASTAAMPAGRVGVVDDHAEALPGLDRLEAAGRRARGGHRELDRAQRDLQQQRERDRAEHVVDVEPPAQAGLERERALRRAHEQLRAVGPQLVGLAVHIGRWRLDAEAQLGPEARAVGVVGVDGAREAPVEERRLGGEVVLQIAVEVEVVLAEVREADRGELRRHEPPLRDRDRRGLHRASLVARLDHRAQRALEVGRLGRRQPGGLAPAADARARRCRAARTGAARHPAWPPAAASSSSCRSCP